MDWLLQNHRDLIDAEFVLNPDSGGVTTDHGKPLSVEFEATEKLYADYQVLATNPGGHSSLPKPDNAIYHVADALAVLETMRGHLKERGMIAFETRNPRVDWVGEWSGRQRLVGTLASGQLLETLEITRQDGEFISFQTSYRSPHETLTTSSTLRFPSREHVEALISRSGLVVRDLFGDWGTGPFEAARSREIIFIVEIARDSVGCVTC